jgi:hypothetical protein
MFVLKKVIQMIVGKKSFFFWCLTVYMPLLNEIRKYGY